MNKVKIYALFDESNGNLLYVGSTQQEISQRLQCHLSSIGKLPFKLYRHISDNNIVVGIFMIEELVIKRKNERFFWENHWIDQLIVWGFQLFNVIRHPQKQYNPSYKLDLFSYDRCPFCRIMKNDVISHIEKEHQAEYDAA